MAKYGQAGRETAWRLVENAIGRDLVVGDRADSEPGLIDQFGVSRGTIREALRLLSFLGATSGRSGPGGGIVIGRPDAIPVASSLAMVLQSRRATVVDVLEAVAAMAPGAAALAAERRGERAVAEIGVAVEDLTSADAGNFHARHLEVQQTVARASGNEASATSVIAFLLVLSVYPLLYPAQVRTRLVADAVDLLEAITDGDGPTALAVCAASRARTLALVRRAKPDGWDAWITWPAVDRALTSRETS